MSVEAVQTRDIAPSHLILIAPVVIGLLSPLKSRCLPGVGLAIRIFTSSTSMQRCCRLRPPSPISHIRHQFMGVCRAVVYHRRRHHSEGHTLSCLHAVYSRICRANGAAPDAGCANPKPPKRFFSLLSGFGLWFRDGENGASPLSPSPSPTLYLLPQQRPLCRLP